MKLLKFKINPDQEIIQVLTEEFKKQNIKEGSISIVGAVDECCISNMPKNDATKDLLTEYKEPLELSGTGEIRNGKPHLHCTLSQEGNQALHGHLHWAKVKTWYISVFVTTN